MPRNRKRKAIASRVNRFNKRFKPATKYRRARKSSKSSTFRRAVMSVVNRNAEPKEILRSICQNFTLQHNRLHNLDVNAFYMELGTGGEGSNCRIGNKAFVKKIRVSIMIEAQQYRPKTQYWLYLVRKKGNSNEIINNQSQMFEDTVTTMPLDWLDTSKADVLFVKKFTLTMPNVGTTATMGSGVDGTNPPGAQIGGTTAGQTNERVTNPQIICKFNVPINKNILYRDTSETSERATPASYRYQWVMLAYDNFSSSSAASVYPVGHVTMSTKLTFTDV
nr:capsid protein [Cressdnaviricota sp.]